MKQRSPGSEMESCEANEARVSQTTEIREGPVKWWKILSRVTFAGAVLEAITSIAAALHCGCY